MTRIRQPRANMDLCFGARDRLPPRPASLAFFAPASGPAWKPGGSLRVERWWHGTTKPSGWATELFAQPVFRRGARAACSHIANPRDRLNPGRAVRAGFGKRRIRPAFPVRAAIGLCPTTGAPTATPAAGLRQERRGVETMVWPVPLAGPWRRAPPDSPPPGGATHDPPASICGTHRREPSWRQPGSQLSQYFTLARFGRRRCNPFGSLEL